MAAEQGIDQKLPYFGCYNPEKMLIDQPLGQIAVGINATVAEERPMSSGLVDFGEIEFDDEGFVFFRTGIGESSPEVSARKLWPQN